MKKAMSTSIAESGVEYADTGSGVPLVFVHGIQGTLRAWDGVASRLVKDHRVIALNLRGRGRSPAPADPAAYTLAAFSFDLESILAGVGEPVVLVGYSMGVSVCLEYVRSKGCAALRGLVLVSGSACLGDEAVWFRSSDLAGISREAEKRALSLGLAAAAAPAAVAASWQQVRQADQRDVLPRISVPTLVLHGALDDQCPSSHGRLLAERIPGARFVEWAGVGHNPMGNDAGRFADEIAHFVAAHAR